MVRRLLEWFAEHARALPWRETTDPYAIWVSEIMLQQTQVRTVVPYWERWMRELPDVNALARAAESRVLKLWEGLGYYRRARNLQAAAHQVVERHGGVFPEDFEDVLALPGVGRYTAGAVCSIAFDQPTPILDGNVIRVLTRLGAIRGDPHQTGVNRRLWREAEGLVRAAAATGRGKACSHFNQALMELGAVVCTPQAPACTMCPVAPRCLAKKAGRPESYPTGTRASVATSRWFVTVVASCAGRFWVQQRPAEGVNGNLWEFPNEEVDADGVEPTAVVGRLMGTREVAPEPLAVVRHAITRYRITQRVYRVRIEALTAHLRRVGRWKTRRQLDELAFASAHRRIVEQHLGEE